MPTVVPETVHLGDYISADKPLCGERYAQKSLDLPDGAVLAGPVCLDIRFARAERGSILAAGTLSGRILAQCQRCLNALELEIARDLELRIVASDTEESSWPEEDVFIAPEWILEVDNLVAEELTLGLPMVTLHDRASCERQGSADNDDSHSQTRRPFAQLRRMLDERKT
ncbi:MAG: DUF177 domain-containing protein [Pseudomonadota bacterium]